MLCEYCAGFSIKLIRGADYIHQPSLVALYASARKGCEFCCKISKVLRKESPDIPPPADDEVNTYVQFRDTNKDLPDDKDGSKGSERIRVFCENLRGGLYFATDDVNAASLYIDTCVVDPDPASATTYRRIKSWIHECASSHPKCRSAMPRRIPTRVIDVSPLGTSDGKLRLHISADGETGNYIALSYCWGSSQPVTTTQTNLEAHKQCIHEESLPKTIRDAISVTRRLGIRYLWVDALCVVQDSLHGEDWHKESSKMEEIYSNAFLTISAEAARNATMGFLHPRSGEKTNRSLSMPYYSRTGVECGSVYIRGDPYLSHSNDSYLCFRAWAFQERRLSRRVLDYRPDQISLACRTGIFEEEFLELVNLQQSVYQEGSRPLLLSFQNQENALLEWYQGVENYSLRNLTYEGDKLPALSGFAHAMHKFVGGTYLAGIWKHDLLIGLLWFACSTHNRLRRPSQRRAPSWSWAALDGGVDYSLFWMLYSMPRRASDLWLKPIEDQVTTVGIDSMGQVTGGMLKVSGHIKRAAWLRPWKGLALWKRREFMSRSDVENWDVLRDISADEANISQTYQRSHVPTNAIGRPIAICLFDTNDARPKDIWCLAVVSTRGLILEYLAEQNVYQRVGFFTFSDPTWMSKSPVSTITIV